MDNYNTLEQGEIYLSSLSDYGRDTKTILLNFIEEAGKNSDQISMIYTEVLEGLLLKFKDLSYRVSAGKFKKIKCVHANQERAIATIAKDNTIILPITSISNIGSDDDTNRSRYKGTVTYKKIWDKKKGKAVRVVGIAPKPVNITYELNVWSKYVADMDQITSQIRRQFNPHITISTKQNIHTKAFLVNETHNSTLEVGDGVDRLLLRTFTLRVETYINYPEYLFTSSNKIQLLTQEIYEIISGPITKITDGDVEIPNPKKGVLPRILGTPTGVQGLDSLAINYIIPEFGPYYVPREILIEGEGFTQSTQVRVGDNGATSVQFLDSRSIIATIPAFDLSTNNTYKTVTLTNTTNDEEVSLPSLFFISPIPSVSAIDSRVLDNGGFSNSSLALTVSGEYFDSYLDPYYIGSLYKSKIYLDGVEYPTEVKSDGRLTTEFDLTFQNSEDELTVEVRNYNGSAIYGDTFTLPEVPLVSPGGLLSITSVTPNFGPYTSGIEISVSGTGFNNVSSMALTLGGSSIPITVVPKSTGFKAQLPAFSEDLAGNTYNMQLTVSAGTVKTTTFNSAYTISPEPYLGSSISITPTVNGTVLTQMDIVIDGSGITDNITPYYDNVNTTYIYASSVDYPSIVQLSALTLTDTSVSGTFPVSVDMANKFFSLTVSNINGSGSTEELIYTSAVEAKTTQLGYIESSAITDQLIQATVPITPASSVPRLWIDGEEADVFPVSYDPFYFIDVVQVVGPASGGGVAKLHNDGTTSLPISGTYNTLDLSGVKFVMDVVGKASPMVADLFGTQLETLRQGKRLREYVYHDLIKDESLDSSSNAYTCGNVKSFITRRSDTSGVDVWVMISNDNYDVAKDPRLNSDTHTEVAGDVWFNSMQISSLPSGYRLYSEFDDGSMDSANGWVVSAVDNGDGGTFEQVFPALQKIVRHYVIGPDTPEGQAEAEYLFTMGDHCEVRSGYYSYYETSGYGAQRDYLPQITNDCQKVSSPVFSGSGWDVMDFRCSTTFTEIKDAYINDVPNGLFQVWRNWGGNTPNNGITTSNMKKGYYQPYGHPNSRQPGGFLIHLRHGWQNSRWIWRTSSLQMMYQSQRHDSTVTKLNGFQLYAKELAQSNPDSGSQLYSPWSFAPGTDHPQYWFPWFSENSSSPTQLNRCFKPNNRVWNSPSNDTSTLYYDADSTIASVSLAAILNFPPTGGSYHFGPYEGDHSVRWDQTFQPLIWSCNLGIAKWMIRQEAAHFEHVLNRYPILNTVYNGTANGPNDFMSKTFNMYHMNKNIKAAGNSQWGRRKLSTYPQMQRGWGHMLNLISEGMRVETLARRNELFEWAVSFTTLYSTFASNVGTIGGNGAKYNTITSYYGEPDLVNSSGATPVYYEGEQLFMTAFASHGILGVLQSFFGIQSFVAGIFRKTLEILPYYLWKYADDIGNEYAQNYVLHSNTTSGYLAPPPSEIVGWDFATGFIAGYSPVAEMKCSNLLYAGLLLTNDIKYVEWFYILMTEFLMTNGQINPNKGMSGFSPGIAASLGVKRPTNVEEAIKLFNQVAGQYYAANGSYGWETENVWANHAAQIIGLLPHITPEVKPAPTIPPSIYT
jgi:hypothetical protein